MNKLKFLYPSLLFLYSLFSYLFVDRNLLLSNNPSFIQLQRNLWIFADASSLRLVLMFISLISIQFIVYVLIIKAIQEKQLLKKDIFQLIIASIIVLIFAYPALSHDVFNYIFNAKMVIHYQANPHTQVALDYAADPWTRFMHNTHTPAPYGYGWTGISLLPAFLGFGRLKVNIFMFKALMVAALIGVLWLQAQLMKKKGDLFVPKTQQLTLLAIFGLNPLLLIETVGNVHNDIVMMFFVLASYYIYVSAEKQLASRVLTSIITFGVSVSIKFASLVLIPSSFIYKKFNQHKTLSLGAICSLLLLIPLITTRSQRYLPWYLIWSLSFIPFIKEPWLRNSLIAASFAALLGYVPFLYAQEYNQDVLAVRTIIMFIPPLSFLITDRITNWKQERK